MVVAYILKRIVNFFRISPQNLHCHLIIVCMQQPKEINDMQMQGGLLVQFTHVFIFHPSQQCAIFEKNIAAEFTNMNFLQHTSCTRMRTIDNCYEATNLQEKGVRSKERRNNMQFQRQVSPKEELSRDPAGQS